MGETRGALGIVCSSHDEFLKVEEKVAGYMMEHKVEVVDMAVGELARTSGTSDTTISQFCRRYGFKGFYSLKLALVREVLEEEQMDRNVSNDIGCGDLRQSLRNILTNKVIKLTETVNMMDLANLEHILDRLEHARMVQLAAVGNTTPVTPDGAFKLNQLGIPAVAGDIWGTQTAYTLNLGQEGVAMVVSNSGSSKHLQIPVGGTEENGCTVIFITDNGNSPLTRIYDCKIVTATREKLLTEELWFSRVTVMVVMEILHLLLRAGMKGSMEHIRRHEKAIPPGEK